MQKYKKKNERSFLAAMKLASFFYMLKILIVHGSYWSGTIIAPKNAVLYFGH